MMHDFALTAKHVDLHGPADRVQPRHRAQRRAATCPTAGTTTTAPASVCCAATTRSARCAGSRSTRATCSTSPTPMTPPTGNGIVLQAVRYPGTVAQQRWLRRRGRAVDVDDRPGGGPRDRASARRPRRRVPPHRRPAGRAARPVLACRSAGHGWVRHDLTDRLGGRARPRRRAARAKRSSCRRLRRGRREQRLVPRIRLRPGARRQRPGDRRRVRLRGQAGGEDRAAAARARTASTETGSALAERGGAPLGTTPTSVADGNGEQCAASPGSAVDRLTHCLAASSRTDAISPCLPPLLTALPQPAISKPREWYVTRPGWDWTGQRLNERTSVRGQSIDRSLLLTSSWGEREPTPRPGPSGLGCPDGCQVAR